MKKICVKIIYIIKMGKNNNKIQKIIINIYKKKWWNDIYYEKL